VSRSILYYSLLKAIKCSFGDRLFYAYVVGMFQIWFNNIRTWRYSLDFVLWVNPRTQSLAGPSVYDLNKGVTEKMLRPCARQRSKNAGSFPACPQ
jgi:hypothetical protein